MRLFLLCLVLLSMAFFAFGQAGSLPPQALKEVFIQANRLHYFSSGNHLQKIDSTLLKNFQINNLADLLASQSQVFIKSYGLGSLATPSLRGTGASHTAVLWNGFNLQNSMNGNVDFALLPVFFLENAHIQHGGAGALFGSGAVGGAIHLNNTPEFRKGLQFSASLSAGSFADFMQGIKLKISKEKFVSSLKLLHHTAQNNFSFINIAKFGKPTEKQSNSAFSQYGFLQENYFKINDNQQLDLQIWYLNADRQIPPTLTTSESKASQQDESLRLTSNWQLRRKIVTYFVRAAFFKEKLVYQNPDIQLTALSKANTWIGETESKIQLSPYQLLNIGLNHTYFQAETDGYRAGKIQHRTSLFFSHKISSPKDTWNMVIGLRKELIDKHFAPFTPSLGFEKVLNPNWTLKGNIAKTYRVPTFNDLYWQDGGNPNLRPEDGWSGEIGIEYGLGKNLHTRFTAFNSLIDNWIAWLPNSQGRWSANNVLQVWSRGVELSAKSSLTWHDLQIQPKIMYNYVISTNQQIGRGDEQSLYKQLIYVPKHTAQASLSLIYKNLQIFYNHSIIGERFTTSDNTQKLPVFTLGNLSISQKIKYFSFQVQVNNLWNVSYQQIAFRPMPMRNWVGVVSYQF
ncbi:TonB-dependent receptor plug domain-containing protein [Thermoflexibacter ruber]|nr:TonB-dependent receptor [Thermoflexibacter ruber]